MTTFPLSANLGRCGATQELQLLRHIHAALELPKPADNIYAAKIDPKQIIAGEADPVAKNVAKMLHILHNQDVSLEELILASTEAQELAMDIERQTQTNIGAIIMPAWMLVDHAKRQRVGGLPQAWAQRLIEQQARAREEHAQVSVHSILAETKEHHHVHPAAMGL